VSRRVNFLPSLELTTIEKGLEFMLGHFSEPLFPRKISTAATHRKQYEVDDKDRAMLYYQAALWEDCRISGYGLNQINPDLIFIDLDGSSFKSKLAHKRALEATLKNIENKLDGAHPTVLWSGRGYHIIQPIDCPMSLENIKELAELEPSTTSNKFLQFAERYLSKNKHDKSHHPAIKSCMLRVPGSINSKCKTEGLDPEVKIILKWDRHRPDYRLLIGSFYADLVGRYHQHHNRQRTKTSTSISVNNNMNNNNNINTIPWIEKLLQTPIEDYRKHARDLILVPYLVVRKGMTDQDQIYDIVMSWADKCAELKRLEPSRHEFAARIRSRIYEVIRVRVPPMTFETLKEKCPELYETLRIGDAQ
jgi:hypothetical protein